MLFLAILGCTNLVPYNVIFAVSDPGYYNAVQRGLFRAYGSIALVLAPLYTLLATAKRAPACAAASCPKRAVFLQTVPYNVARPYHLP